MSFLEYLFPVRLKDLEAISIRYAKEAMDDHVASLQVSFLWRKHSEPKVSRSSSPTKKEEGRQ